MGVAEYTLLSHAPLHTWVQMALWCRKIVSLSCCLRRHGLHTSLGRGGIVSEGPGLKNFISEINREVSIQPDHFDHGPVPYVRDGTIQGHGRRGMERGS